MVMDHAWLASHGAVGLLGTEKFACFEYTALVMCRRPPYSRSEDFGNCCLRAYEGDLGLDRYHLATDCVQFASLSQRLHSLGIIL